MKLDGMTSQWMVDLHDQLLRGKHVLLYGNVGDQFLHDGEFCLLPAFLSSYFRDAGYEIVCEYDVADGLRLSHGDAQRFESLAGQARGARSQQEPRDALPALRRALAQSATSVAVVLHFADRLTGDPERPDAETARLLVELKKALHGAASLRAGPLAGRKNALVLVAAQLGGVSPWIYREDPLLALVQVKPPRAEERGHFVRAAVGLFHGGGSLSGGDVGRVCGQFVELTDSLGMLDLEAIRRTSIAERISIGEPKALVHHYKYGRSEDPWEKLDEGAKILGLRAEIEGRVIGQSEAVLAVIGMLATARVGIRISQPSSGPGRPKGAFFFVGPTGVGKTELAKALAKHIFGDEGAYARFDMSEYQQEHSAERLIGAPPGYVGFDGGGQLTNRVRAKPFSLLLFDEIEKADKSVMDKFLQILEDGRLTDGKGETADFSQTLIIFTSNEGSATLPDLGADGERLSYDDVREHYRKAVRKHFFEVLKRPEIYNRLGEDNVLVFDILRDEHIGALCARFLEGLKASARERRGLEIAFRGVSEAIVREMEQPKNRSLGYRRIRTLLESMVERPLNVWVVENAPPRGASLTLAIPSNGRSLEITRGS